MIKFINLHSGINIGECAIATVSLSDRAMTLEIEGCAYGNHHFLCSVRFNSTSDIRALADGLKELANESDEFFAKNP